MNSVILIIQLLIQSHLLLTSSFDLSVAVPLRLLVTVLVVVSVVVGVGDVVGEVTGGDISSDPFCVLSSGMSVSTGLLL